MILPHNHHVTMILVRYIHEKNGHFGHKEVLTMLQERFWVVKARIARRQIMTRCIVCRKQRTPTLKEHRPLTRNPTGPDDEDPLKPSHFLNIKPSINIPINEPDEKDMYRKKKWQQPQLLSHHYWKR